MVSLHSHLAKVARALLARTKRGGVSRWLIALALTNGFAIQAQTNSLLSRWLAAQTSVQTWSADFTQTKTLKSLVQPLTATGRVWFANPNRFRWELGHPPQTIALRSGDEMRVIYPNLKRVERYPLSQAGQWRDVLALLEAGFPRSQADVESRFHIQFLSVTNGACEVTMQPKSAAARKMMPQIKIAFRTNDFSLSATELQFADGSTMRNDFTNAILNPKVDDALFTPELGSDFKIVEPLKQR
jgi:outer membrane lipoprotein-sorting protein